MLHSRTLDQVVSWSGTPTSWSGSVRLRIPVAYSGDVNVVDMTLLASVWSPEGFALVADGLQVEHNVATTDCGQKIDLTPFIDGTGFAFGCSGTCQMSFGSGESFNFLSTTASITKKLAIAPLPSDPADYFREIAKHLYEGLAFPDHDATRVIDSPDYPSTKLFFVGYYRGQPLWVEFVFDYVGTRFSPPQIVGPDYKPRSFRIVSGSNTIRAQMDTLDAPVYDLREAIEAVRLYATVCIENNKTVPDCANLGGHVHIATVTPTGSGWDTAPLTL